MTTIAADQISLRFDRNVRCKSYADSRRIPCDGPAHGMRGLPRWPGVGYWIAFGTDSSDDQKPLVLRTAVDEASELSNSSARFWASAIRG